MADAVTSADGVFEFRDGGTTDELLTFENLLDRGADFLSKEVVLTTKIQHGH
jgi:hypothetical protein